MDFARGRGRSLPGRLCRRPALATASAQVGHARWAQATPGWAEPPHLWLGAVGGSGTGKSPGADCLPGEVLPEIERRQLASFPDKLRNGSSRSIGFIHRRLAVGLARVRGSPTPSTRGCGHEGQCRDVPVGEGE